MKHLYITLLAALVCACSPRPAGGPPAVLFGGEMHNSNASVPASADASLDLAQALGYNCVLAPVSWAQTETAPGVYDFSLVDHLLQAARKRDLYLGLLWFGTWKNGDSSYPPRWIRQESFYALAADGTPTTTISPFCESAREADARAFKALMQHLRTADRGHRVLCVQVENECGAFLERDCSPAAREAWETGGWAESDDPLAPQRFMAAAFADYVNAVAAAGKEAYDIPMFTNAWLADADKSYGRYPNGGPRVAVLDVWREHAPALDWLSPDIYGSALKEMCAAYGDAQPLFIPETNCQAGRFWYALGEAGARGVFGFGYEEFHDDPYFVQECRVLSEMLPLLEQDGPRRGFVRIDQRDAPDAGVTLSLGGYDFRVHYIEGEPHAHGMVLQTGEDSFVVAGVGAWIDFGSSVVVDSCEELRDGGVYQVLNGDETGHHHLIYLRGRLYQEAYTAPDGTQMPAPMYGLSGQRRFKASAHARFKVSGIYRIHLLQFNEQPAEYE